MVANQPVQPDRTTDRNGPRCGPAERPDQRGQGVIALDLRRYARAAGTARMTAPGNRAEPEARRRRRLPEPGHQRELIIGRCQRRG